MGVPHTLSKWKSIVIAMGFLPLVGCLTPKFVAAPKPTPATAVASLPDSQISQNKPRFAELVAVPGQRIPLRENATAPIVVERAQAGIVLPPTPTQTVETQPHAPPKIEEPNRFELASNVLQGQQSRRGPVPDVPLITALRSYLDNRQDSAIDHLSRFDKPNQELLLLLLPLTAEAQNADLSGGTPKDPAMLMNYLEDATAMVARVAPLIVRKTCFVSSVAQYGVYEPILAGYRFLPGGMAMLYIEIGNVPSVPTGSEGFATKLVHTLQIHDANGKVVEQFDKRENRLMPQTTFAEPIITRSQVHDFFVKFEMTIPEKPGKYTLTFEVRDPVNARKVRKTVDFQVAG